MIKKKTGIPEDWIHRAQENYGIPLLKKEEALEAFKDSAVYIPGVKPDFIEGYEDTWYSIVWPRDSYNETPSRVLSDGTREWLKDGILHRGSDLPAVICPDGSRYWYKEGLLHREGDKPAIISAYGYQAWYLNGVSRREGDRPTVEKYSIHWL